MTSDLPIVACSEVLTAALRGAGAGSIEGVAVVGAGTGVGRVGSGVAVVPGAVLGFHIMGPKIPFRGDERVVTRTLLTTHTGSRRRPGLLDFRGFPMISLNSCRNTRQCLV